MAELQGLCTSSGSPLVFSHNDLLSGNILLLQQDGVDVTDKAQVPHLLDCSMRGAPS